MGGNNDSNDSVYSVGWVMVEQTSNPRVAVHDPEAFSSQSGDHHTLYRTARSAVAVAETLFKKMQEAHKDRNWLQIAKTTGWSARSIDHGNEAGGDAAAAIHALEVGDPSATLLYYWSRNQFIVTVKRRPTAE